MGCRLLVPATVASDFGNVLVLILNIHSVVHICCLPGRTYNDSKYDINYIIVMIVVLSCIIYPRYFN